MKAADQAGVGVRLVEGKEHLIFFLGEIVFEGETRVILVLVMRPQEVDGAKGDLLSSFEPPSALSFPSPSREDGDGHALSKKGGLLGQVGQRESPDSLALATAAIEEPIVVAVGVDIILH